MMTKNLLTPAEITGKMLDVSEKKANNSFGNMLLLGIMAGMFIALGSVSATVMWGTTGDLGISKFLGAAIFPVGIILVILAGAELFTGNNLMSLGLINGRITAGALLKNWTAIFVGNFIGSIFIAFLVYKGELWGTVGNLNHVGEKAVAVAQAKAGLTFSVAFFRAILCNIVVSLSVWMSLGATTAGGKILTLWFPVTAFVMASYEHVVANMFFIPVGIFHGAAVTWSQMAISFIPVTLGNIVGGGIIVPVAYHFIYLKAKK